MAKTTVVNRRTSEYDVYIGRGSAFGNPFVGLDVSSLFENVILSEDPIRDYRRWLLGEIPAKGWVRPSWKMVRALRGKRLGCYCAPKPCHGDVLVELADRGE